MISALLLMQTVLAAEAPFCIDDGLTKRGGGPTSSSTVVPPPALSQQPPMNVVVAVKPLEDGEESEIRSPGTAATRSLDPKLVSALVGITADTAQAVITGDARRRPVQIGSAIIGTLSLLTMGATWAYSNLGNSSDSTPPSNNATSFNTTTSTPAPFSATSENIAYATEMTIAIISYAVTGIAEIYRHVTAPKHTAPFPAATRTITATNSEPIEAKR
jgi:hypothetical protein